MSLQTRIRTDRLYGLAITIDAPAWPSLVQSCGVDFVFLDTEHCALDRRQIAAMCRLYRALQIAPIVRIPSPDPYRACQAIDDGAMGVVAPYIETVEQLRELVGATKYRPLKGARLRRILRGDEVPDQNLMHYLENYNAEIVAIANIESRPAVENLDELLALPGLDAVFIGPHDLSCSLDIPEQYDHPDFERAVATIIEGCRRFHLGLGVHFPHHVELQIKWIKAGANIVLHSADMRLFQQRLNEDLARIRAIGDESGGSASGFVI
ncbi:aldolase [candidate division KSB1 bacterium]|nr:aldolase [candidate division KSB1 bacterium]